MYWLCAHAGRLFEGWGISQLERGGRWRGASAGAGKRARMCPPMLALSLRWRSPYASVKEPNSGSVDLSFSAVSCKVSFNHLKARGKLGSS